MTFNTNPYKIIQAFSFFLFCFLFSNIVQSDELLPPQQVVKQTADEFKEKLKDPSFKDNFSEVTSFIDTSINPNVDFDRISFLVLGKLWKKADANQRGRFKKEFQSLLVRTYSRAFFELDDWSVRYLPIKFNNKTSKVIVKTEVLQSSAQPIKIDYRMVKTKGKWKVYDIMIEGVSLVTNYRSTFKNEVARNGSVEGIITRLAERNKRASEQI